MIARTGWAIGAILLLIALGAVPVSVPTGDDFTVPATKQPQSVQPFTADTTVTQQFPATGATIQSIDFQFGLGRATNRGTLRVSIATERGGNWQTLRESRIATQDLTDGRMTTLPFDPPLNVAVGQSLRLTVQPDADAAMAVVWLTNPMYTADRFTLAVNDAPQMGTARFGVTYAPLHGRLFQTIGPVFARITVLLNSVWRAVLVAAGALFIVALLAVVWLQPRDSTVPQAFDSETEEAILGAARTSDAPVHRSAQEGQG